MVALGILAGDRQDAEEQGIRMMLGPIGPVGLCLLVVLGALAPRSAHAQDIRVDVPVALTEAKVVFNLDRDAFTGDEPTGLHFLRLMTAHFKADGTKARI